MKIGMQTWGSYGDIRPLLALAEGLQSSGHQVSLTVTSVDSVEHTASLSKTGVKVQNVRSPIIPDKDEQARIFKALMDETNSLKQLQILNTEILGRVEDRVYQVAEELCANNDLVIGQQGMYPLHTAAEKAGRNHVSVMLLHTLIPTRTQPPAGFPKLGGFGTWLGWRIMRYALNKYVKPYSDRFRVAHGLGPARDLITDVWSSRQLTLVAVSRQICRPPPDWPDYYQVCGFLDTPTLSVEGQVSEEMGAFLSRGDPPVYATFGSLLPRDIPSQKETARLLSEAAAAANCRAIIQAPRWQECGLEPTPYVHYVEVAPHSKVFPRCKAVIHHGGAGTTQAAMLAGKPSVVVAHLGDQGFWGQELERLGVAPPLLRRKGLTAAQLAKSVKDAVGSTDMANRASGIGAAMSREKGVDVAVELINDKFNGQPRTVRDAP